MAHPFVWHELMTTDPESAAEFYTKVTGWTVESWDQDSAYHMFAGPGGPLAGFMQLPEDARAMGAGPSWLTYIGTPDVDDTTRRAEQLGALILRAPEDIPNVGRFSVIRDPQGAVFSAFTPNRPAPPSAPGTPAPFSWHELATTDVEGAMAFYGALFGFEKTASMDMGPNGIYQMYGVGGETLGGVYRKQENQPTYWLPYALVQDSQRASGIITSNGGSIMVGPMEVPGGDWIVVAMDPQGAPFAVHSKTKAAAGAARPQRATGGGAKQASTKKAGGKAASKVTKKSAKKAASAAAQKVTTKKTARKTAKKAAKKPARKTANKSAKKRTAKSSGRKAARPAPRKAAKQRATTARRGGKAAPKKTGRAGGARKKK